MKSNREMRAEAWKIVTGSGWSWRLLVCCAIFVAVSVALSFALSHAYGHFGVQTWESFSRAQAQAKLAGIELAVSSARESWRMTCASSFEKFVSWLFSGIFTFGLVQVLVKCLRDEREGWFDSFLGGFVRPLEMFWLTALMSVKVALWTLLFIVPGVIALFRYALAWYVKVENPDLGANDCLKRSDELMYGHKMNLLAFGFSYLGWFFLALVPVLVGFSFAAAGSALALPCFAGGTLLAVFAIAYAMTGQAVFYREVKSAHGNRSQSDEFSLPPHG